jgi:hypothetical protein
VTLSGVREFFADQMTVLKMREWTSPFTIDNIPSTIFDKAYHLDLGRMAIASVPNGQGKAFTFDNTVTLKFLRKGFDDASKAVDAGLDQAQNIIGAIVVGSRGLDQKGLKIVVPTSLDVQPFSQNNTHAVVVVLTFKAVFILGF